MNFKNLFTILFTLSIFFSCKKEERKVVKSIYKPREIKNITLQKFDHTKFGLKNLSSIRSIELVDKTAFFIAEQGKIYAFYPNGNFLITPNDFFGKNKPNFRAGAHAKNKLYALSIESPTLLYQIEMNSKDGLTKPKVVYKEVHKKSFYDAIAFFNDKKGIAIGDPTENCLSIILTNDGGNTWNKVNCENLPKLIEGEAAFAVSNTNIAIQGSHAWIITGGVQSRVLHTADYGENWDITNTPMLSGGETSGAYTMAFNDSQNGIICGGDYLNKEINTNNKAITTDGGKTWTAIANGIYPGYISCVQYVPNTDGKELFAVSTEGIYFSNNSGKTWIRVHKEGYYTIKFIDKNNAWLAGNGKIAKMKLK